MVTYAPSSDDSSGDDSSALPHVTVRPVQGPWGEGHEHSSLSGPELAHRSRAWTYTPARRYSLPRYTSVHWLVSVTEAHQCRDESRRPSPHPDATPADVE